MQLTRERTTTTAMMQLICGMQSCPQHCHQCQWLMCNLSCQPLQRCCLGPHDPSQYSHRRGLGIECVRPEINNCVIVHIQRSARSRPWRRQGSVNAGVGHAGCSGNAWLCGGDKSSRGRKRNHCRSRMHRRSFWKQTGELTRKQNATPQRQREQRPVFACAAWRNAIGLADGAAQLDDVRADMQHLALTCASDAPRSASEALQRSDAEEWHAAKKAEVASCLEHSTWHSCELPEGTQPLPSHFVYAQKQDGRYKARLVAGGHKQQQGVDYDETFAPVCSYHSVRMMLAVAAHEGLELRQFDIKAAFLHGYLEEEVYIRSPHGWKHLTSPGRVSRLDRALYGLRQASRAWNKHLEA
jgi:hypothetical protein